MEIPEKRHHALKPFSNEHNKVLILCSRIEKGLQMAVPPKRIKRYADWLKKDYLDPHFEWERKYVFPILGIRNFRVKRALANHRRLNRLFEETTHLEITLNKIEEELGSYIRFEERILYNEIQKVASSRELQAIEENHRETNFSEEAWEDRFWDRPFKT